MQDPDIKAASDLLDAFMDKALAGQKPDVKATLAECKTPGVKQHFLKLAYALATLGGGPKDGPGPDDGEVFVVDYLEKLAA